MADTDFTLTKDYLHQIFEYKDGNLYWKINKGVAKTGDITGCFSPSGYLNTTINRKTYRTHRLIFMWHYGFFPEEIDHEDGNSLNNRIENLRPANRGENCRNRTLTNKNKSGIKGVSWCKDRNKWRVQLQINGKKLNFGDYNDIDYAKFIADAMRYKYHKEFANHG